MWVSAQGIARAGDFAASLRLWTFFDGDVPVGMSGSPNHVNFMCYMTLLSTTSDNDLTRHNNALVAFSKKFPIVPEKKYLGFSHQWFIGSQDGCSCCFRHLGGNSIELGFTIPVDWFHEDAAAIEATHQVCATIRAMVATGAQVDVVDAWAHGQTEAAPLDNTINVNLAQISDDTFRFFENYRFVFSNDATNASAT
jgi:hypothetical protein